MRENIADDVLQRAWVTQPTSVVAPPLAELKRKARRARLPFALRNALEYGAVLLVVVMASAEVINARSPWLRIGHLLIVAGMLYLVAQLHARASARKPPRDGTAMQYLAFLRIELARQQQALATVWRWYLLPFVPGTLVITGARAMEEPEFAWLPHLAGFGALLFAVHLLNRFAAARIGKRLAALDAMAPEGPG